MTSAELNQALSAIDGEEFTVRGLEETGKALPYIGWYWRDVDFDRFLEKGYAFGDCTAFVGFMENNKWDYGYHRATAEQCRAIHALLLVAATAPTNDTLQAVFDAVQAVASVDARAKVAEGNTAAAEEQARFMAEHFGR